MLRRMLAADDGSTSRIPFPISAQYRSQRNDHVAAKQHSGSRYAGSHTFFAEFSAASFKAAAYWSGSTSANSELSWMRTGKPCPLFAQTLATVVGMAGRYHLVKEDDGELQKTSTRTCATACSIAVCHWAKAAA
jgi:hypothetical protein